MSCIKSDSLELAIELENKGHEYYKKHAAEAENPLAKRVLESLASQELDHIETIKKISAGQCIADVDYQITDVEDEVKDVFKSFSKKEREGWKDTNVDVYQHALDLEEDIYNLYKELAQKTDDESEKKFFEDMMEQEMNHYESIENVYNYFNNPGDWFATEESKVWPWMNT